MADNNVASISHHVGTKLEPDLQEDSARVEFLYVHNNRERLAFGAPWQLQTHYSPIPNLSCYFIILVAKHYFKIDESCLDTQYIFGL